MKKYLAISAAIVAISTGAHAIDIKSMFGGGQVLQKFAVKAEETTKIQPQAGKPYEDKRQIFLECDFTVALECTNAFVPRTTATVWIRRDANDKEKPYTVVVEPGVTFPGTFDLGKFSGEELAKGIASRKDAKVGTSKREYDFQLKVIPSS